MHTADEVDPAARLWDEYERIFDRLEVLTKPNDTGYDAETMTLIDRARVVIADLSFVKPTTPQGAVACLRAAKHFASEAIDASDEDEQDNLHRATERCIEAAMLVLEDRAYRGAFDENRTGS